MVVRNDSRRLENPEYTEPTPRGLHLILEYESSGTSSEIHKAHNNNKLEEAIGL